MALVKPLSLLVLAATFLKIGPDISSSHAKQSFNVQFGHADSLGTLYGSFQSFKHGFKHFLRVFFELKNQIWEHGNVNPSFIKHLIFHSLFKNPLMPHLRTGAVKLW